MRVSASFTFLLPAIALAHGAEPLLSSTLTTKTSLPSLDTASPSSNPPRLILIPIETLSYLPATTLEPNLELRQVVAGAAQAQPSVVSQMSPITTITQWEEVNGVEQQVAVVYTQTFAAVPEQWPGPSAGSVGLGTIQGQVGVTKTKRSMEATAAAARPEPNVVEKVKREANAAEGLVTKAGASSGLALAIAIAAMIAF